MTLTQMQYFDTLCRYENYTRAAQALFVSQPTISQAIRDLEKECGAPLVCRIGNGLKITPEGEILWEQIRPILRQVRELEAGIAQDGLSQNYIRIGFSIFSGNQVFPQLCRAYHEKNPKVRILTRESDTPTLLQMLENDQLDGVVTCPEQRQEVFGYYPLISASMAYAVSKDSPLANKKEVTLEEIAKYPLVLLSEEYASGRRQRAMFQNRGLEPEILVTTHQMYTIERFVERGAAGGFLPRHLARFNSNIVMLSFPEEEVPQETCLVWKKGVVHSTAVRSFIELAKSCFPKERGSILMASS